MNYSNAKYYFLNSDKFWNSSPFVKISASYCIGIIFYKILTINIPDALIFSTIAVAMALSFQLTKKRYFFKNQNFIAGFYIFIILFFTGYLGGKLNDPKLTSEQFLHEWLTYSYLSGVISNSTESGAYARYEITIENGLTREKDGIWENSKGKVILFTRAKSSYKPGDKVLFKNQLKEIPPPKSKFDTDFKSIYKNKGIFLQQFLSQDDQLLKYGEEKSSPVRISYSVNHFLKEKLNKALSRESYSIAAALLLGDKSVLDENTKHIFSKSGIMHVLAVSGLHVGILFLIIQQIFSFIKAYKNGKIFFLLISLIILWSFAFVTGLSNSVIRATIMFSIFSFGPLIGKRTFGHNITAFSAFLILLFNPNALFEVSFQLSYLAVFSILFFYQDIYQLLNPRSFLLDKMWQIISVSIAAQIGTFPLVIYYFHHFQPLFLVFNLLAIPFAFLALTGGIFYLAVSFIPIVSDVISLVLDRFISFSVNIFELVLKYAPEFDNTSFHVAQVALIYFLVFFATAFLFRRKNLYLSLSILTLLIFNLFVINKKLTRSVQQEVLISKSDGQYIVDIVNGANYFSIKNCTEKNFKLQKEAQKKRSILGAVNNLNLQSHYKNDNYELIVYSGKTFFILSNGNYILSPENHFDYILLNFKTNASQTESYKRFADNILSLQTY